MSIMCEYCSCCCVSENSDTSGCQHHPTAASNKSRDRPLRICRLNGRGWLKAKDPPTRRPVFPPVCVSASSGVVVLSWSLSCISLVCLVHLVCLVRLVCLVHFVQLKKQNKPNKQKKHQQAPFPLMTAAGVARRILISPQNDCSLA